MVSCGYRRFVKKFNLFVRNRLVGRLYRVNVQNKKGVKIVQVPFFTDAACDTALCRIAEGDHDALTVIYKKLGRQIYMLAYSILQDTYSAEDVMQETFVRLLTCAQHYQPKSNAKAYVLRITRNLALNALQKRQREVLRDSPIDENTADESETQSLAALEALKLLSEEERQIVVLKLDGGQTHRQIASLLGISTAACEKKYRRALEKLKQYYRN